MRPSLIRLLASASLLCLSATAMAQETAPVTAAKKPNDDIRLRQALTVEGIMVHEKALFEIAKKNKGNRAASTKGYSASVEYVSGKLKQAGYNVKIQSFSFNLFSEIAAATLAQNSPNAVTYVADFDFNTLEFSGSGSVTGPLVPTTDIVLPATPDPSSTSGCEPEDFPTATVTNSIALIQRGTCTFADKVANAQAKGYAAAIIFNEGQAGRTDLLNGTLNDPVTIPALGATYALGQQLYDLAKTGAVTLSLSTSTRVDTQKTRNIIADAPGGNANRVIVVGAHLDSVPAGPGINDNGSGTSVNLETAIQIARLNLKLRNKVRFGFWGAEEEGLFGSQAYVDSLSPEELAKIELNLNYDMLGSPNFARLIYDGDGLLDPGRPG